MRDIFCVITIGRQDGDDLVVVKVEKAFTSSTQAEEYVKTLPRTFTEIVNTQYGGLNFVAQRGIHVVSLED